MFERVILRRSVNGSAITAGELAYRGGNPNLSNGATGCDAPKTLPELGLSRDQFSKFQQLANVPEDEFERVITIPGTAPSTTGLLKSLKPDPEPERIDIPALSLWGYLPDFQKDYFW